jgi:manganese/zinc/iron transport system permease protein
MVLLSMIQQSHSGKQAGLSTYLFGETAGISRGDIQIIAGMALLCLIIVMLLYKEFELLSFDIDFAASQGWPTLSLDLLMMGTLAIVTIVGLPICGVILMAALIILPGAGARFWTNRLGPLLVIAGVFGAASGMIGTFLASPLPERWFGRQLLDTSVLPPGPLIVLSASGLFLFSLLFAPRRGVVAENIAEIRLRIRISREHVLRALYELSEPHLPERPQIEDSKLLAQRHWREWVLNWWLWRFNSQGLIERDGQTARLTPAGLSAAAQVTRTHRLWELFLVESAGIARDHVDRDADDVEHMLPTPLIRELEARLAATGRMPEVRQMVPESPHEIL